MKNNIQFSVLSYYPNFLNNENINIGILFHNIADDEIKFIITKNWKRVTVFDDEIDLEFTKDVLLGIKEECEDKLLQNGGKFSLCEYVKFYINQYKFTQIIESSDENFNDFIIKTSKYYLRHDYEQKERLNTDDEIHYIKQLMRSEKIKYSTKKVIGGLEEQISFDYTVNNYGFKNFIFENKNITRQIMVAKAWSYTASKIKDTKVVFTYDTEKANSKEFNIIMMILKENAYEVLPSENLFEFIQNISSNKNQFGQGELF